MGIRRKLAYGAGAFLILAGFAVAYRTGYEKGVHSSMTFGQGSDVIAITINRKDTSEVYRPGDMSCPAAVRIDKTNYDVVREDGECFVLKNDKKVPYGPRR